MAQTVRRIAVVGSRTGVNPEVVRQFVDRMNPVNTVLISGGARGVDTVAAEHARERGIRVVEIRANWQKHGRGAGFKRNGEIVLAADDVAAFWDGESNGTFDTMQKALKLNRPLAVFDGHGNLLHAFLPQVNGEYGGTARTKLDALRSRG